MTLFRSLYLAFIGFIGMTYYFYRIDNFYFVVFYKYATQIGTVSALLYIVTLIPGILKRLNIFPLIRASLMLYRRQFGVLMFITAIYHSTTLVTFPYIIQQGTFSLSMLTQRELYGSIALMLLFPLWLTSNEYSVRKLGKWWHWIHALTYGALFLIYLHVASQSFKLQVLYIAMIVLQIISWLNYWRMQRSNQVK